MTANQGGASASAASDSDRPPARVFLLVEEARKLINDALNKIDLVEKLNKGDVSLLAAEKIVRYMKSSTDLFCHIHRRLLKSNPEKDQFNALIISQDHSHILIHQNILSKIGNWDVEEEAAGESAFISFFHRSKCYDMIILHHDLPGLNGAQITGMFRAHDVRIFMVGVCDFDRRSPEKDAFIKSGLDFCLGKPTFSRKKKTTGASTQEYDQVYEYVRGEVSKLGNIVRDIERFLQMSDVGHDGSSSSREEAG